MKVFYINTCNKSIMITNHTYKFHTNKYEIIIIYFSKLSGFAYSRSHSRRHTPKHTPTHIHTPTHTHTDTYIRRHTHTHAHIHTSRVPVCSGTANYFLRGETY